jgi:hypothetical protein
VDLHVLGVAHVADVTNGVFQVQRAFLNDPRHGHRGLRRPVDAEDRQAVRRFLHVVQHVVDGGGQRVNVLAVEGSDEAAVQRLNDALDGLVAVGFQVLHLGAASSQVVELDHQAEELRRGPRHDRRRLVEHVEELFFARDEAESHRRDLRGEANRPLTEPSHHRLAIFSGNGSPTASSLASPLRNSARRLAFRARRGMKAVCRRPWTWTEEEPTVPTRRWLAVGLVLALLSPAPAQEKPQEAKPVKLEWKFEKDKAFYQTLTTKTSRTLKFPGTEVKQENEETFILRWTPVKQEDKNWVLKLKVEGVRLETDVPGGARVKFDSAKNDNPPGPLTDFYKALIGPDVEFTITINAEMQATSLEGMDKSVEALKKSNPQLEAMINQVLTRDNLKQITNAAFPALPAKEVKKGDTWSRTSVMAVSGLGTFKMVATSTYDGPGANANVEKISVKAEMTYTAPSSQPSGFAFKVNSGDLKSTEGVGSVEFLKDRGRADKSDLKVTIKGKLNIDVSGTATDVEVTQTQTTTVSTSDENPVKKK